VLVSLCRPFRLVCLGSVHGVTRMALFGIPCPALLVLRLKRSVDRLASPFSDVGTKVTYKWS
jgi:hypothetical protein